VLVFGFTKPPSPGLETAFHLELEEVQGVLFVFDPDADADADANLQLG
jgi:hypothetical protein